MKVITLAPMMSQLVVNLRLNHPSVNEGDHSGTPYGSQEQQRHVSITLQ